MRDRLIERQPAWRSRAWRGSAASRRALLLVVALVALVASQAAAQRVERRIDGWRPVHYDVRLYFNDDLSALSKVNALVDVKVLKDGLAVVDFDFGEMPVDGVEVGDAPARFERAPGRLNVLLPAPARAGGQLRVTVRYHGRPADGLILTKDKDGNPSATGDNWPDRVHHWIPSLDHPSAKASVVFAVFVPSGYVVVANGHRLMSDFKLGDAPDSQRLWGFGISEPVPPYCMIIAVARFAEIDNQLPCVRPAPQRDPLCRSLLRYYVPPSARTFAERGFAAAAPSFRFFTEKVDDYPYADDSDLAHIVGATRYGGMENSSAIVYPSTLFDPRPGEPVSSRFQIRRGLVEVVAHETAHQWFGDAVTPATWADLWLSEGFATYFAGLFVERYEGEAVFRDYMARASASYLRYEQTRRAPIYDRETTDLNKLLNANNYQKGAWVLHTLRSQLGDATFFRGLRLYYAAHLHANATTDDLRAALERASGRDLREFFARWVYGSGHPVYRASWEWRAARSRNGVAVVTLAQEQDGEPFLTPVPLEIKTADGRVRHVAVHPTGRETTMIVPLAARPVALRIDPDATILKEVRAEAERKAAAAR